MITATFPTRPTPASPPEPPSAVASRPQGQGFEGVFALLQPAPDAPDPVPVARGTPSETAETPPDRPTSDASPDQDKDEREPTGADVGITAQVDRPDQNRVAAGESPPATPPEAKFPLPEITGAPILLAFVTTQVPATPPDGETLVPAGTEPTSPAIPVPAVHAVTGPVGLVTPTRPTQAGVAVPIEAPAGLLPDASPSTSPKAGDSASQGPVPPVPVSPGPAPTAAAEGYEIIEGAGPILLAVDRPDTGRKSSLPTGVPAFWAAREVAEAEAPPPQDSAPPSPALTPKDVSIPKPAMQAQVEGAALLPVREEPSLQREQVTSPASTFPQTAATGQAPAAPLATTPQQVPAGTPTALPPQVPAQIAAAIAARPERPLELRLAPVELGGMTLNLRQDGDILRVVLQADRPDTLDLLRRNGDILLEELRLAGFSGADLSFADDGGARDRPEPAPSRHTPQTDALRAPPAPQPSTTLHTGQGLDLRL